MLLKNIYHFFIKKLIILICLFILIISLHADHSREGLNFPTEGTVRFLIIFADINNDPIDHGAYSGWNKGDSNCPEWADKFFSPGFTNKESLVGISKYFYEASFGKLIVLGDFYPDVVHVNYQDIRKEGVTYWGYKAVLEYIESMENYSTNSGLDFDSGTAFDVWDKGNEIGNSDDKIDGLFIIYRNNSRIVTENHRNTGYTNYLGRNQKIGNKKGINILSEMVTDNVETLLHEFAHHLLGNNQFHSGGGGAGECTFLAPMSGHGLLSTWSRNFFSPSGWDRHRLGWKHKDKNHFISARKLNNFEFESDLIYGESVPDNQLILGDFATTGEAIRIKLPYLKSENADEKNQYLWIENHQILPGTAESFFNPDKPKGIRMYIQTGNDDLHSFENSTTNYNSPLSYFGNYDYTYDTGQKYCYIDDDISSENPLTGYSFQHFHALDLGPNVYKGKTYYDEIFLNENIFQSVYDYRTFLDGYDITSGANLLGNEFDVFPVGTKLAMYTNPSTASRLTYNTRYLGLDDKRPKYTPANFDVRHIYLNGLSIRILEKKANGDIRISIRWDDYDMNYDNRWCAPSIILNENINVKKKLILDQGTTPTQPVNPVLFNGRKVFSTPTRMICKNNSRLKIEDGAALYLKNRSFLVLESGSTLDIANTGRLYVGKDCRIVQEKGSSILAWNKSSIINDGILEYCTIHSIVGGEGFDNGLPVYDYFYSTAHGAINVTNNYSPIISDQKKNFYKYNPSLNRNDYCLTMASKTDGQYARNEYWYPVDLSDELAGQSMLSFWFKEFGDEYDSNDGVYFSDDNGITFTKVMALNGKSHSDKQWYFKSMDIAATAARYSLELNMDFVIKFQQYDNYGLSYDGFAFDEINIRPYAGLPYTSNFENGSDKYWQNKNMKTENHNSFKYLEPSTAETNIAYLHLNLNNTNNAYLLYRWKSNTGFSCASDGVYLSNDGGINFKQLESFNLHQYTPGSWRTNAIPLAELAQHINTPLNNTSVIKFCVDGINCSGNDFAIDDIKVVDFAAIPYATNFESFPEPHWYLRYNSDVGETAYISQENGPYYGSSHLEIFSDGEPAQADLHVDLSDISKDAILSFWGKQSGQNSCDDHGIYLSADFGNSFTRVYSLKNRLTDEYRRYELNLSDLANSHGLNIQEPLIIRFQHYHNYSCHQPGGTFAFDAIEVKEQEEIYQVPFRVIDSTEGETDNWNTHNHKSNEVEKSYKFYLAENGFVTLSTCSDVYDDEDNYLELYHENGESIAFSNDDRNCDGYASLATIASVYLTKGFYYIIVEEQGSDGVDFELKVDFDNHPNRYTIPFYVEGDTWRASDDWDMPNDHADVAYIVDVPYTMKIRATTCTTASQYGDDTQLAIYKLAYQKPQMIAHNDDAEVEYCDINDLASTIEIQLEAGFYYFVVDGFRDYVYDFGLSVTKIPY